MEIKKLKNGKLIKIIAILTLILGVTAIAAVSIYRMYVDNYQSSMGLNDDFSETFIIKTHSPVSERFLTKLTNTVKSIDFTYIEIIHTNSGDRLTETDIDSLLNAFEPNKNDIIGISFPDSKNSGLINAAAAFPNLEKLRNGDSVGLTTTEEARMLINTLPHLKNYNDVTIKEDIIYQQLMSENKAAIEKSVVDSIQSIFDNINMNFYISPGSPYVTVDKNTAFYVMNDNISEVKPAPGNKSLNLYPESLDELDYIVLLSYEEFEDGSYGGFTEPLLAYGKETTLAIADMENRILYYPEDTIYTHTPEELIYGTPDEQTSGEPIGIPDEWISGVHADIPFDEAYEFLYGIDENFEYEDS
jgi:hypothetical protein